MKRPMRRYKAPILRCAKCDGRFIDRGDVRAEHRMVDGQIYHVFCAPAEAAT